MPFVVNMWIPTAQGRPPSLQAVTKKHSKDAYMEDIGEQVHN